MIFHIIHPFGTHWTPNNPTRVPNFAAFCHCFSANSPSWSSQRQKKSVKLVRGHGEVFRGSMFAKWMFSLENNLQLIFRTIFVKTNSYRAHISVPIIFSKQLGPLLKEYLVKWKISFLGWHTWINHLFFFYQKHTY